MPYKSDFPVRLVRMKAAARYEKHKQFFQCIRMPLLVCRWMGLLPIEGLRNKSGGATRFTLKSLYSIVYIPSTVVPVVLTVLILWHLFLVHNHRQAFTESVACIFTLMIVLTMMRFSLRWPMFLHEIETIELLLPLIENYKRMSIIIKSLTIFVLVMGLVEHVLFTMFTWAVLNGCQVLHGSNNQLKSYYLLAYDWFYQFIPFSYFSGIVVQISIFQSTFLWNYNDVLIIVLSVYLTSRFKSFNRRLILKQQSLSRKCYPSWSTLQVHYTRISRLVTIIDHTISPMVLVSYACNLLYIFKQILHIINRLKGPLYIDYTKCSQHQSYNTGAYVYVTFTTVHALIKTALVSFLAAELHTTSRESLSALHTVPASDYNNDMQRLMEQVYNSKVCLTGCKLFSVTRSMILAMVATLITYEVVLFQF